MSGVPRWLVIFILVLLLLILIYYAIPILARIFS